MPSALSRRARTALAGRPDGPDEILGRLLGEPVECADLGAGQRLEVGEILHPTRVDQLLDRAVAQVLDVHRPPRPEVTQPLLELGGGRRCLVQRQYAFTGGTEGDAAARRALGRKVNGWVSAGRLASTTLDDVRDHVRPRARIKTVSPTRMSFRRISSSLCRLTLRMVTPASSTGESLGRGRERARLAHVHLDRLDHGRGLACANLNAIAQRGWWVVEPSRRWCSRASTLTTTPSAS